MSWRSWLAALGVRTPVQRLVAPVAAESLLDRVYDPDQRIAQAFLLEDMVSVLHRNGTTSHYVHTVVQVFDAEQLAHWEVVTHVTPVAERRVRILAARVFRPDTGWIDAKIERTRNVPTADGPSDVQHVTLRGLVPGCIIDLEQLVESRGANECGPHLFVEVMMETSHACRLRRLAVAVPEGRELHVATHRWPHEPRFERRRGYDVRTFEAHDTDARTADIYTPVARDELPTVEVSTLADWRPIGHQYREMLSAGMISQTELLAAVPGPLPAEPEARAAVFYDFVARQVRYGRAPELVDHRYVRSPSETVRELRGDCKDKVRLLTALLERDGFECHDVLVQAAEPSARGYLPAPRFDHVVLRARRNGRELWFEPTPGCVDFDYVPSALQGTCGLVLESEPRLQVLPVHGPDRNRVRHDARGRVDPPSLELALETTSNGEYATEIRQLVEALAEQQLHEQFEMQIAPRFSGVQLLDLEHEGTDRLDREPRIRLRLEIPRWVREAGDYRLLRMPWQSSADASRVGMRTRDRGLVLGNPRREHETLTIEVPDGWRFVGGTIRIDHEVDALRYALRIDAAPGRIKAERVFEIRERTVDAREYVAVRDMLHDAYHHDAHDLVFRVAD